MQSQRIHYLLDGYIKGLLTGEEQRELAKVLHDPAQESFFREELVRLLEAEGNALADSTGREEVTRAEAGGAEAGGAEGATDEAAAGKVWEPVLQRVLSVDKAMGMTGEGTSILRRLDYRLRRWSVAAILLLVAGGGVLLFLHGRQARPLITVAAKPAAPIQPGANKAVLTLANGQRIILNNAQNGTIGQQGNIRVIKLDSGQLAYATPIAESPADQLAKGPLYNTITTPRGGQYQVTLADGTKVWLNAESSLRFPTAFTGKDREVELTGEAYFEVKADKDKPFLVQAGQTETRVLGTNFNIMAYSDEGAVKTTLLEGAVSMGLGTHSALLQPGQQGQYDDGKNIIATRAVNTRAVVAWKDGYYFFDRTPVKSVMRQIARWYDVTIVYKGAAPEDEIVGKLPRTADVREVLHIMELIGIHFRIDGKTIIVGG
jgi:transmembrane sensor